MRTANNVNINRATGDIERREGRMPRVCKKKSGGCSNQDLTSSSASGKGVLILTKVTKEWKYWKVGTEF